MVPFKQWLVFWVFFFLQLFDEEKTGYIHKQSFKRILQSAFQITDEDTDALFQMADADKNSLISFGEHCVCGFVWLVMFLCI